jgi:hypothetical protein
MVQATQWQVDNRLLPTNPYQKIRYYPAFPGGMRAFGAHPVPLTIKPVGSPNGFSMEGGLSGGVTLLGRLGLSLPTGQQIATGAVALLGLGVGAWLARKNIRAR